MNQISVTKDSEQGEPVAQSILPQPQQNLPNVSDNTDSVSAQEQEVVAEDKSPPMEQPMDEDSVIPATVFTIMLKQSKSDLQHKMSVPELCRNFRSVQ